MTRLICMFMGHDTMLTQHPRKAHTVSWWCRRCERMVAESTYRPDANLRRRLRQNALRQRLELVVPKRKRKAS